MYGIEMGQTHDITNFSAVIHPHYKWSDNHKTILELGTYSATTDDGSKVSGQKYTIAQAITAGPSFWHVLKFVLTQVT